MAKSPNQTLILTGKEVAALLDMDVCIAAVEEAFRLYALGQCLKPGVLGIHVDHGGFHIKAAGLTLKRPYFVAKTNANFPENPTRRGLPTIMGTLVLHDAADGRPLAVMDSMMLTALRTAAATAVAAKHLARADAKTATLVGCGMQGGAQVRALKRVRPIEKLYVVDADRDRARRFAEAMAGELGIAVVATGSLREAAKQSNVVVTCTTAKKAFLGPKDVGKGAFIAAVGADNPEKQEITPQLLAEGALITDSTEQCAAIGDLHHALDAGVLKTVHVRAELGQVIAGQKPGRKTAEETVVFDSTGIAVQDTAAAAVVYEQAVERGVGLKVDFAG
jgi:ornithine cyclodeaminase/alanine dehydrogenase-like protein (mu-crystallin family)